MPQSECGLLLVLNIGHGLGHAIGCWLVPCIINTNAIETNAKSDVWCQTCAYHSLEVADVSVTQSRAVICDAAMNEMWV
jgi:hypothetical protein